MTEEEAKTKWCPMIRTGMVAGMAVNHHVDMQPGGQGVYDETRCIASDCMMWRDSYCGLAGPITIHPIAAAQAVAMHEIKKAEPKARAASA